MRTMQVRGEIVQHPVWVDVSASSLEGDPVGHVVRCDTQHRRRKLAPPGSTREMRSGVAYFTVTRTEKRPDGTVRLHLSLAIDKSPR